jgi:A/G-specific adenine glycosylase
MIANTNKFPANLSRVRRMLLAWYKLHGRRDLPWRNTRDAYRIYLSEIMLQQTQVKTVLERYYAPFLKRFPTLKALALAEREAVIKQWEGLGYYTRARNLHEAARQCGEALPGAPKALMALPGIGRNTANAIACFAFGAKVPVMEANVRRVLCRIFALKTADDKVLWQKAAQLLDTRNAFDYNQAMMDIGAMVCTKRVPRCFECPLAVICEGKFSPESYPAATKAKTVPVRRQVIVVFAAGDGRYYLQQRQTRFLGGLYGFMEYEADAGIVDFMKKRYPLRKAELIGAVTQAYSHFTLDAKVYRIPVQGKKQAGSDGLLLATLEDMARLPLSGVDHKVVRLLAEH